MNPQAVNLKYYVVDFFLLINNDHPKEEGDEMVEKYDVVVAGGGPAGLVAAKAAAAEGAKVLLLELQAQIGGQTQSASWVPKDLLTPKLKGAVATKLKEVRLHALHEEVRVRGDLGAVVDRRQFDKLLAAEAASSGAEIWLSAPVRELLVTDGAVRGIRTEAGGWSEQIQAEVVVDATGARGEWSSLLLRKVLGKDWHRERLAFSNEYLMANLKDEKVAELIFTSYFAPGGYAWIYPLEKGFAIAGIQGIRIHPDAALDEFIGKQAPPRLTGAVPVAAFRSQLPLGGPLKQTCADGIIAVGGSAGQIYPLSGQGLRYALRCGEIAGRVAVDAVTDGDVTRERLSEYEQGWRSEFGSEFEVGGLLHSSLSVSQDRKMDSLLRALVGKPRLQRAFIDVFTGFKPMRALPVLLKDAEIARVFGRETVEKALALK
ncbi:MAG: NAD(P)/FAD-dependent oxidoreductase [Candidatus Hodarchaeaceae archaeon]|nr:NAD(P)/FAD-dependent oxidoreductase [Candidatus Hodarchaeaceae archaeon]